MIFVTIGTQVPFDRMVEAVDKIVPLLNGEEVIVQAFGVKYQPKNQFTILDYISPADFKSYIDRASLVISHAGTGTILNVSQMEKPMIVFPRSGKLKETRNDHQMATCRMLEKVTKLQVAYDEDQLKEMIQLYRQGRLPVMDKMSPYASDSLLGSIRGFLETGEKAAVVPVI